MTDTIKQSLPFTKNEKTELSSGEKKWIWDKIPHKALNKEEGLNGNVGVSGNVNHTYKRRANFESSKSKQPAIAGLKECNYRTSPKKIASLLEELFSSYDSKPGHWLYTAQHWPPRPINRVINYMIKRHQAGWDTIKNPAAYFTYLLKFREKRRCFRAINGSRKQQK